MYYPHGMMVRMGDYRLDMVAGLAQLVVRSSLVWDCLWLRA